MSCEITHTPLKPCFLLNNSEIYFCLTVPRAETMIGTIIPRKERNVRNSTTQKQNFDNEFQRSAHFHKRNRPRSESHLG